MDVSELDRWAAEYNGEQTDEEVQDAVEAKFYTGSPAAAFAVLKKVASDGADVTLRLNGNVAEVAVGEVTRSGKSSQLGVLIIEACKEYVGGKHS